MSVTLTDVKKIASLAHLTFSEPELQKFTGQLNEILGYVDQLNKVNTESVAVTYHPVSYPDVFRPDEIRDGLPVDKVLRSAPDKTWQYFSVPKVVG